MDPTTVTIPYPAQIRQVTSKISDLTTTCTLTSFSDKIMITVSQNDRLGQWVTVPLLADNPTYTDSHFNLSHTDEDSLIPVSRFQPRTLLGGGTRETMGQLYACQIASLITTKSPEESRVLLLGLGLAKADVDRDVFLEILNLVTQVL